MNESPPSKCPGFDRLDAIMSIEADPIEKPALATYVPMWSSGWAAAMGLINSEDMT